VRGWGVFTRLCEMLTCVNSAIESFHVNTVRRTLHTMSNDETR
jgi:hypothetical protein